MLNEKLAELDEQALEQVSGGKSNKQQIHGMPCPVCKGFIPMTMKQLQTADPITCPHCGLYLEKEGRK